MAVGERGETDADAVVSAARRYRELYELAAGNDELDEAWADLCDALDELPE